MSKNFKITFILFLISLLSVKMVSSELIDTSKANSDLKTNGSYYTDNYPNLFKEFLGKTDKEINQKIENAYDQLFYGDDKTQRIYYLVGSDMAYIEDINNKDVRTEGMSYGMMVTVQLNKQKQFNRIWKWAKTYMQHQSGQRKGYFAWHCKTNGDQLSPGSASDGEEWFVMTLFFASARWGDGEGIYNYSKEANEILDAMLSKTDSSDDRKVVTNIFNKKEKQVVFVPDGAADDFTDPSYHLPHYYELWSLWAENNNKFWSDAAETSRLFFKRAANPKTGLSPDYANFDGTPKDAWNQGHDDFRYDAWRTIANIAIDYTWFEKNKNAVEECNLLLNFFYSQGIGKYGNNYTLEGKELTKDHSTGLVAMNAVACLASNYEHRKDFVNELWNVSIPDGPYRYYDGVLYILGMLQVSGNFKIYKLK